MWGGGCWLNTHERLLSITEVVGHVTQRHFLIGSFHKLFHDITGWAYHIINTERDAHHALKVISMGGSCGQVPLKLSRYLPMWPAHRYHFSCMMSISLCILMTWKLPWLNFLTSVTQTQDTQPVCTQTIWKNLLKLMYCITSHPWGQTLLTFKDYTGLTLLRSGREGTDTLQII